MDRERQTLELLQLLGDDVAEVVLSRLQPEQAAMLRTGMQSDRVRRSTIGRQRAVLDEFDCFFQFALKSLPRNDRPTVEENETRLLSSSQKAEPGSGHAAADQLETPGVKGTAGSGDEADQSVETQEERAADSTKSRKADKPATPILTGIPLLDLQTLSAHQLATALSSEQPRTCAILLSSLPGKFAGDILSLLKAEHQKMVMKELTKEQHAPEVLIERIARATLTRAQQLPADPPDTRDHADRVAELLRSVPKAGRREMLAVIEEQDPDLAKSLLTRIYRFDDIASLGKTVVQRVLGEIDSTNLTTALFGAAPEVTEAIFSNLSKRARQTIEEEMQFMSNMTESRIQQARDSIAEIIAKIDMESES
jgi:flagellar motor switch protein FliG